MRSSGARASVAPLRPVTKNISPSAPAVVAFLFPASERGFSNMTVSPHLVSRASVDCGFVPKRD